MEGGREGRRDGGTECFHISSTAPFPTFPISHARLPRVAWETASISIARVPYLQHAKHRSPTRISHAHARACAGDAPAAQDRERNSLDSNSRKRVTRARAPAMPRPRNTAARADWGGNERRRQGPTNRRFWMSSACIGDAQVRPPALT